MNLSSWSRISRGLYAALAGLNGRELFLSVAGTRGAWAWSVSNRSAPTTTYARGAVEGTLAEAKAEAASAASAELRKIGGAS